MGCNESKGLVECIEDYFLVQIYRQTNQSSLGLSSEDELIKEVNIEGGMRCNNCTLVEFGISRNMDLGQSKVRTLDFRRAKFQLLKVDQKILLGIVLIDKRT